MESNFNFNWEILMLFFISLNKGILLNFLVFIILTKEYHQARIAIHDKKSQSGYMVSPKSHHTLMLGQ